MIMVRPRLVISRCIELEPCRYNGAKMTSELVRRLMPYVELLPVCMEADMGLGVPRDPVRIERSGDVDHLIQPATGLDLTERAATFTADHLAQLKDIDGFVLKGRSPSCGIKDVRIYPLGKQAAITNKGAGMYAREVLQRFPEVAMEDEARLMNSRIADHFLTRTFTNARFRRARDEGTPKALMDFHASHKLLLMGYNQEAMRAMGRVVASNVPMAERFERCSELLVRALGRPPRCGSWNNVLMHAMGYFSERLTSSEKDHFLQTLRWHAEGKIPLTVPLFILRSWSLRYEEGYLLGQVLFEPYPLALMDMMDGSKCTGRDLWAGT